MPYADPEKRKEMAKIYRARWYANNREKHIANVAKNRKAQRKKWLEFKASLACCRCGIQHPAVIDFHHITPEEGRVSVYALANNGQYGAARKEIERCIPLCANCHRITHHDEKLRAKRAKKRLKAP